MKTKLPVIAVVAILVGACTTGTYMTKTYDDDIYFSPADVPPVAIVENETPVKEKSAKMNYSDNRDQKVIVSQTEKKADGSTAVNNYIYQPDKENKNSDNQDYNMNNQELAESDTTIYYNDDDVKYVINNYYDENDNDIDFAYRIGRFHNPFYYSPFYDDWNYGFYSPWYSGFYGMNYGWGYDPFYSFGWGYPYSYYGYSPFSFGFGGYWGGGYGGYNYGYYGGGSDFHNDHRNRDNVRYGRSSDFSNYAGGNRNDRNTSSTINRSVLTEKSGSIDQRNEGIQSTRTSRTVSDNNQNINSRTSQGGQVINNENVRSQTTVRNGIPETSFNGRRSSSTTDSQVRENSQSRAIQMVRPGANTSGNVRRVYEPSTTGRTYDQGREVRQSQNYTPSYNKPRIVNQSNFNNNSYTRPRTSESGIIRSSVKSANSGSTYSQPRSSSSMRQTYRSSSSYSSGSSSSPGRSSSSYSSPSSGSGSSYSAPERSSGSGGGNYGGGSGGSSDGGSGGRSGSGGRR